MFFERSASRFVIPSISFSASIVIEVRGIGWTSYPSSDPSSSGFPAYPAFCRLRSVNASLSTTRIPLRGRSLRFVFSAAGFIATRTFGASPAVRMS